MPRGGFRRRRRPGSRLRARGQQPRPCDAHRIRRTPLRHAADDSRVRPRAARRRGRSCGDRGTPHRVVPATGGDGGSRSSADPRSSDGCGRSRWSTTTFERPSAGRSRSRTRTSRFGSWPPSSASGISPVTSRRASGGRARPWRFRGRRAGPPSALGALATLGGLSYWRNEFAATRRAYEEALEISTELEDLPAMAEGSYNLAFAYRLDQDASGARELLETSSGDVRAAGRPSRRGRLPCGPCRSSPGSRATS